MKPSDDVLEFAINAFVSGYLGGYAEGQEIVKVIRGKLDEVTNPMYRAVFLQVLETMEAGFEKERPTREGLANQVRAAYKRQIEAMVN